MRIFFTITFLLSNFFSKAQIKEIPYLLNESYTYSQLIEAYKKLDKQHNQLKLVEVGLSDVGKPIHLVVIDKHKDFESKKSKKRNKTIVFINNGIHAGEACGIDASVEFVKNILDLKHPLNKALDSVVVVIIPVYNVGGMLNRGAFSRANQNGPKMHGFRGNAKNLDLNRDFIKLDSRNANTFTKIFRKWDPDIFIDTHTTNGSDHQYTLTLIATQKDKLNPVLSAYAEDKMIPAFYSGMSEKYMDMIPYIYSRKSSPDLGIMAFMETPRYSSGYVSLFDCYSFITEAHVFKSFENRVKHTLGFLETVLTYTSTHTSEIIKTRQKAKEKTIGQQKFTIKWELDTTQFKELPFNGYTAVEKKSELTGQKIKFYDKNKPFSSKINYFDSYSSVIEVEKPTYYIIPQAYNDVIERLKWNGVLLKQIQQDSLIELNVYYIEEYDSPSTPYEGHFLHSDIEISEKVELIQLYKGDYLIETNQATNRYIVETLEPQSQDGFFAWNFFEGILQQKEWFSDYAFEPIAKKLLEEDEKLKEDYFKKKELDAKFAANSWAQLYFIYKRSSYFEKTVNRFPIYRIK